MWHIRGFPIGLSVCGEMKKGMFSIMNYKNPLRGIASMHCSANTNMEGDVYKRQIKRCQPKTLNTTNCSGKNKDFVRKPILPEEYIILTTE